MEKSHTFQELIEMTRKVMAAFERVEQRPWSIEVTLIELMKQSGDLAKRVMLVERYYLPDRAQQAGYQTDLEDIGDELADILYCLIRVAEHYGIDLEMAHLQARRKEMRYVGQEPDF